MDAEIERRWRRANRCVQIGIVVPPAIFIPLDLIVKQHEAALFHLNLAAFFGAVILMVTLRARGRYKRDLDDELKVIGGLVAEDDHRWHYGYDLVKATRLRYGRAFKALTRLIEEGLVEDQWEDVKPWQHPRRMYRLSTSNEPIDGEAEGMSPEP